MSDAALPLVYVWDCGGTDELVGLARAPLRGQADVREFDTATTLIAALRGQLATPALIVLLRSRPSLPTQAEVECVGAAAPLTPLVMLAGAWCEGEPRSGQAWPGVIRCPLTEWESQLGRYLAALAAREVSSWQLPATATEDERLLMLEEVHRGSTPVAGTSALADLASRRELTAVVAQHRATSDWLLELCAAQGLMAVAAAADAWPRVTLAHEPALVLWHEPPTDVEGLRALARLRSAWPDAAWVGLVNFARDDDRRAWCDAGLKTIVALPALLADLEAAICRALAERRLATGERT